MRKYQILKEGNVRKGENNEDSFASFAGSFSVKTWYNSFWKNPAPCECSNCFKTSWNNEGHLQYCSNSLVGKSRESDDKEIRKNNQSEETNWQQMNTFFDKPFVFQDNKQYALEIFLEEKRIDTFLFWEFSSGDFLYSSPYNRFDIRLTVFNIWIQK